MNLEPRLLEGRFVRLEPLEESHREALGRALDCDPDTWLIMSGDGRGKAFEGWWDAATGDPSRIAHAVRRTDDGQIVGTSSYLRVRPDPGIVEIGWTFYRPDARGGPVNPECKLLMIGWAFEAGAVRVELMVDARNERSQAAVTRLGALREGVMRNHMRTWTGHLRDTVMFSIVQEEWPRVRAGLQDRVARFATPGPASSG